ncbi:hypothetical protein RFI_29222, partial [Reticulomyxa filosa]
LFVRDFWILNLNLVVAIRSLYLFKNKNDLINIYLVVFFQWNNLKVQNNERDSDCKESAKRLYCIDNNKLCLFFLEKFVTDFKVLTMLSNSNKYTMRGSSNKVKGDTLEAYTNQTYFQFYLNSTERVHFSRFYKSKFPKLIKGFKEIDKKFDFILTLMYF